MEQTRTEALVRARAGSASPAASTPPPAPEPAAAAPRAAVPPPASPAVRGEHVHDGERGDPAPALRGLPRRHSVRGQVLAALRQALVRGDLVPGRVYSAPALAERHGVSPTPVREAMQQLACEGLIETVPNRGFRIVRHSARDTAELAEVRLLLELPVVLRLVGTQSGATWDALRPLADRTVTAAARGDRAAYAEADRAFHRALLAPAGNQRLADLAEDVQRRVPVPAGPAGGGPTPALVSSAAEHVSLLEALSARDSAAAERILRAHLAPGPAC